MLPGDYLGGIGVMNGMILLVRDVHKDPLATELSLSRWNRDCVLSKEVVWSDCLARADLDFGGKQSKSELPDLEFCLSQGLTLTLT